MRNWLTLVAVATGCYSARAPSGAPCDPGEAHCPSGQTCTSHSGGYFCLPLGTLGTDAVVAIDDAADAQSLIDAAATHFEYVATVADCINPNNPNPDLCTAQNGPTQLVIDADDSTTDDPWESYLRFELDAAIAGRTVTSVKLRLTATDDDNATGSNTGAVFRVQSFTRASLSTTTPATIGIAIAGTQGSVAKLQVIEWALPVATVTASSPVFLGLITTSSDGVNYWNLSGTAPPRLIIDVQ